MASFAAYNPDTGRIDHVRESDITRMQHHFLPAGHLFVEYDGIEASPESHFVLDGIVTEKQSLPGIEVAYSIAADAIDVVAFTLPAGTIVNFEGIDHSGEEDFRFTADIPGTYLFRLLPPAAFKDMEVTIHAI